MYLLDWCPDVTRQIQPQDLDETEIASLSTRDFPGKYPANSDCFWRYEFLDSELYQIDIKIEFPMILNIQPDSLCERDYLMVGYII